MSGHRCRTLVSSLPATDDMARPSQAHGTVVMMVMMVMMMP
jgi:hypothetical protein